MLMSVSATGFSLLLVLLNQNEIGTDINRRISVVIPASKNVSLMVVQSIIRQHDFVGLDQGCDLLANLQRKPVCGASGNDGLECSGCTLQGDLTEHISALDAGNGAGQMISHTDLLFADLQAYDDFGFLEKDLHNIAIFQVIVTTSTFNHDRVKRQIPHHDLYECQVGSSFNVANMSTKGIQWSGIL
jgi:hypothetical protein